MLPQGEKTSLLWTPLVTICVTAFAVEIPFFFFGAASGHDFEFHLNSWLEVLMQWKQGIFYPRWASLAHFAYGEPRFIFYPPASWTLGAALSAIFPWTIVPDLYIWIVLVAAGISMFVLARQWLSKRDAIFAAALYAANPYHLVIVYWRSAFAELLGSIVLPLLVLAILRARAEPRRAIGPLAVLLAAAWLINAPAAVMIHYSLALLIVWFVWKDRSPRLLLVGIVAVAAGACLAAFYLAPAIYEQRWVNIAQALAAGLRPVDGFLFVHTSDAAHDAFNRIVSILAVAEMVAIAFALWMGKLWRDEKRGLWPALSIWAAACSVAMFPITNLLWEHLPKLRFMQFPWRWLLCLSMLFSILITVGVRRWWARVAICVAMLLVVGFSWQRIQTPWWDTPGDLRELQDNVLTGAGYEGTDEYTPLGADASSVDKDARRVAVDGPQLAAIHVYQWNPEEKDFTAEMSAAADLSLHLFNYPAWQVKVNDRIVQARSTDGEGQMLVPVEAGANRVQIRFVRTRDRKAGAWISLFAWLLLVLWRVSRNSKSFTTGGTEVHRVEP